MILSGDKESSLSLLRLSVRDFVSFAYKTGGLASNAYSSFDGMGTKVHQQFFKSFQKSQPDSTIYTEHQLKTTYEHPPIKFEIQGRADLIVVSPDEKIQVIEIKTIPKANGSFPENVDFLHIAQARIYAYLFCLDTKNKSCVLNITIKYILINSFKIKDFNETISFYDLEQFFLKTCANYYLLGKSLHQYEIVRNESISSLSFPYPELRLGQKDFMNTALSSIKKREPLFIQAPTGIGKTVSALYPAIKTIPKNYSDYIFYLTAKNSTQDIAKNTLDDMRKQGLIIKSIQITAKEKICLCKDIYCDTTVCPYAINYYLQNTIAMNELSQYFSIDMDVLQKVGEKYSVCPFELGLDMSLFCDIIIGDYNYIFDPKVQLERFVKEESYNFTILVDEAHNLPDRLNEMYSGTISQQDITDISKYKIYFSEYMQKSIDDIMNYFVAITSFLSENAINENSGAIDNETTFDSTILSKEMVKASNFCATRKMPGDLLKILTVFVELAKDEMENINDFTTKKALLNLFFAAKFFIRISEEFYNDSYITTFSKENRVFEIKLKCMDSAKQLDRYYQGKHAIIYFSATLSPVSYFESRFKSPKSLETLNKLVLPSPFPRENLFVGVIPGISTKYNNRRDSLLSIAEIIDAAISSKVGNYFVYSPSFEYQQWIIHAFELLTQAKKSDAMPIKIIKQTSGMSERNRQMFLERFKEFGKETLVAFAVMGGIFGEGIDLAGETLSGVILVGVGLPKKSLERDIIMDYYSSTVGNGYDFAYRFPGFNKIQQAAGRVIRSENDRGFILLLDERYQTPEYQALFPDEWTPVFLKNKSQVKKSLKEFLEE
ncbi:MAG: ATP-dependent DNA helicase [Saccharofermentanales bacterium]